MPLQLTTFDFIAPSLFFFLRSVCFPVKTSLFRTRLLVSRITYFIRNSRRSVLCVCVDPRLRFVGKVVHGRGFRRDTFPGEQVTRQLPLLPGATASGSRDVETHCAWIVEDRPASQARLHHTTWCDVAATYFVCASR